MGRGPTIDYYKIMNDNYIEGSLTCLKPEIIKENISEKFPLVLNIEPTNDCNAKCYYCTHERVIKNQGINYLHVKDFRRVIDQIPPNKLIMLNLHKDGEPLLHEDLPAMVEYAKEKDAAETIHLNTNGILINTKIGRGIIERGIDDITISVDAAFENTYQRLKGVKDLDDLESNVKEVINYRDMIKSETEIRVKIMEFKGVGKEEVECFIEKWTDVADDVQVTGIHNWNGAIKNINITDEVASNRYPCALLWYMMAINSNGDVSVCCVDWDYSGVIGNIGKQNLRDIWNGERVKKIRKAHLDGDWGHVPNCKECVLWVSAGNAWDFLKSRKEFL